MTLVYDGVDSFKPKGPLPIAWKKDEVVHVVVVDEQEDRDAEESWKALQEVIGIIDDEAGPTDVAENHDRYLYGDLRPR